MSINTRKFKYYFMTLFLFWTSLVLSFCCIQYDNYHTSIINIATKEAELTFLKDKLYRDWVTKRGGVYVPASDITPPNPYLYYVKNRDVVTTDGMKLTLVNPAYMLRQVFEMSGEDVIQGHLTSDKLLNPNNKPDEWEYAALMKLHKGEKQVTEKTLISGKQYLRFMRPFMIDEQCLKCHAHQGYKVGDIRGGISVKVPLSHYYESVEVKATSMFLMSFVIWAVGTAFLFYTFFRMKKMMAVEEKVNAEKGVVLKELNHRVKNNLQIIASIIDIHVNSNLGSEDNDALLDIQGRLLTMSEMHNMFESQNHITGVDSKEYISKVILNFMMTHIYETGSKVDISYNLVSETLSGTEALSCGLIINELLTNSYKYAFDETISKPEISINFAAAGGEAVLLYKDNGVGCDFGKLDGRGGFGLMIIDSMADKMKCVYTLDGSDGVRATFKFKTDTIRGK